MSLTCKECGGSGKVEFTRERGGPTCNTCGGAGVMTAEVIQRNIAALLDGSSVYMGGPSHSSLRTAKRIVEYLASIDAVEYQAL